MAEKEVTSITLKQMPLDLWRQFRAACTLKGKRIEDELPEAVRMYLAAEAKKGAKK